MLGSKHIGVMSLTIRRLVVTLRHRSRDHLIPTGGHWSCGTEPLVLKTILVYVV